MKIKLSPVRMNAELSAEVQGDIIILNGESLDLSPLPDGGVLPAAAILNLWVLGDVERIDGDIHLTLILPHGPNAPYETRFPSAYSDPMTVVDGPLPLPPYDAPPADDTQLPEPELEVMP